MSHAALVSRNLRKLELTDQDGVATDKLWEQTTLVVQVSVVVLEVERCWYRCRLLVPCIGSSQTNCEVSLSLVARPEIPAMARQPDHAMLVCHLPGFSLKL